MVTNLCPKEARVAQTNPPFMSGVPELLLLRLLGHQHNMDGGAVSDGVSLVDFPLPGA